jgi:neutral ceramidase
MLRVGAGSAVITPPIGLDLEGYLRDGPSVEVLDELRCQAVVFDDGVTRLVVASCDLIGLTRQLREMVCSRLDLPAVQVLLNATHTHCGPGHLASPVHTDLTSRLAEGVVRAITSAIDTCRPARLFAGTVPAPGIAGNRRDPAGPVEETATFLVAYPDHEGVSDALATIVNFACHPTVQGSATRGYSADFPGAVRGAVEGLCGGHALYLQGMAGDVNPVRTERTQAEARRVGAILGAAVGVEVLSTVRASAEPHVSNPSTGSTRAVSLVVLGREIEPSSLAARWVDVPVRPWTQPSLAAVRAARSAATDPARVAEWTVREYLVAGTGFDSFDFPATPATLPVQAFRLGVGLTLLALPGEPFTATGQRVRAAVGGTVLVAGYANQAAGYLPTEDEFERSGYEVGCSMYAPGTVELLTEAGIELLAAW